MDDWIYFSLVHKENPDVELKCCIDLDTIDDDEPDVEYLQNDGTWNSHLPNYWKVDGKDLTTEMEKLKEIEVYEWDWISQALVDVVEESDDEVFIREFDKATLYMSYDRDFEAETATKLPQGAIVENNYPFKKIVPHRGDMSEYTINNTILADTCHLIFRKTLIYDDEIVYDVFALVGGSNGKEIEVGTVDNLEQVDRFVDEFQEESRTKVLGKTIKDGYGDLKQDWR